MAGTINNSTAPKLNCAAVVEAANAGITPEGNKVCETHTHTHTKAALPYSCLLSAFSCVRMVVCARVMRGMIGPNQCVCVCVCVCVCLYPQILESRGIPVCPDVVVNGGGVVVSFFEWVQNMNQVTWDLEEVLRKQER